MHIDWFVFFAQIVNFLILVFLLKKFLYSRIIKAMENRENLIVSRFAEAETMKKEAAKSAALLEEKNKALAEKQEELVNQMVLSVEHQKKDLLEKARRDVDTVRERWQETMNREKDSFLQDLRQRAGIQIYSTVRRILKDMTSADIEEQIVRVFIRQIENMDEKKRAIIKESMVKGGSGIIIQSSFPVSDPLRIIIRDTLKQHMGGTPEIQYEIADEIISGIELRACGHKLAWSINDYLETLEEDFAHALLEEARVKS